MSAVSFRAASKATLVPHCARQVHVDDAPLGISMGAVDDPVGGGESDVGGMVDSSTDGGSAERQNAPAQRLESRLAADGFML